MSDVNTSEIWLMDVRLSFPALFEKKAFKANQEGRYEASFIIDKETHAAAIELIKNTMRAVAKAKWGDKAREICTAKKFETCLHEGSEKPDTDGYGEKVMYVTSSSQQKRPLVVDKDKSPLTKDDDKPYGGCYVNAKIRIWAQDNEFGKRINAALEGVQFKRDGERFGAGPMSADEFPDEGETASGDAKEKPAAGKSETKSAAKGGKADDDFTF